VFLLLTDLMFLLYHLAFYSIMFDTFMIKYVSERKWQHTCIYSTCLSVIITSLTALCSNGHSKFLYDDSRGRKSDITALFLNFFWLNDYWLLIMNCYTSNYRETSNTHPRHLLERELWNSWHEMMRLAFIRDQELLEHWLQAPGVYYML